MLNSGRSRGSVWIRVVGGLLALGLGLLVIRERFEPWLSLYLDDLLDPKPAPQRISLREETAVWLYTDARPHIGKIDELQKGLVLTHGGKRLVEEAYGFGLPLVIMEGHSYVSRHATVTRLDYRTLVKQYTLDTVDRPARFLRRKYEPVDPIGTVVVTYTVRPPEAVDVSLDFGDLPKGWEAVYVMNEQGALAFTHYRDAEGQCWDGRDVGIWREAQAPFGCWISSTYPLRFCVEVEPGTRGFVGRERYNQYHSMGIYILSWAGIDLELRPPVTHMSYTVRIESGGLDG